MEKKKLANVLKIREKINPRLLIPLLIIVILFLFFSLFKGRIILATVNGQPVWRLTVLRELEKQSGKKVLDALVTKILVLQEAKKQKVTIGEEEISQEIKRLEETLNQQGQNLDQLLKDQGLTRDGLREEIKLQKLVEKLAGKDIIATDEEIKAFFEKNQGSFPKTTKLEDVKDQIKNQLEQEKLATQIQSWLETLRQNAKINYF